MNLTFTLQSAYTGATYVAGPFNISGTTSGGSNNQLATGVTKNQLIAGYSVDTVLETLTGGTITSTGTCGTSQEWFVGTPSTIYYSTPDEYPRSNVGSSMVNVINNTGAAIYVYLRGNSQSTNSGTFGGTLTNVDNAEAITLTAVINNYAQISYSTGPLVQPGNVTTQTYNLVRDLGSVSGPKYDLMYSTTNGGTKYPIPLPVS